MRVRCIEVLGSMLLVALFGLAPVGAAAADGEIAGTRLETGPGISERTDAIMLRQQSFPLGKPRKDREFEGPDRSNLKQNPDAIDAAQFPPPPPGRTVAGTGIHAHTTALSFDGATLTDTGAFPPDSMGSVGPSQYVAFENGRLRTFTKSGVADGVINADPDVFFASVMTPVAGSVVLNFTSDPQVRYDRFTARWYLTSVVDLSGNRASYSYQSCPTPSPTR